MELERILVTGGAGFIGSALVRKLIRDTYCHVANVDSLTYAGNLDSLGTARSDPRHAFEHVDIRDGAALRAVFAKHKPQAVVHLAAESHVDRSIHRPDEFVTTNVVGTHTLLEVARAYYGELPEPERRRFRFHHVSTDEVYGDLAPDDPPFTESTSYAPSSPYSASKAASDHLVRAWHRTFGLPILLTNCSNNYGPYQFPEKLIPLMILQALEGKRLPVYGKGDNVRDWLYVEDHAAALLCVLEHGTIGRTYNIGGQNEKSNLEVVHAICRHLDQIAPRARGPHEEAIEFVTDRPGHDRRYAIDTGRICAELGWSPAETFESGLRRTVEWYVEHPEWIERVRTGAYRDWLNTHYDRGSSPE